MGDSVSRMGDIVSILYGRHLEENSTYCIQELRIEAPDPFVLTYPNTAYIYRYLPILCAFDGLIKGYPVFYPRMCLNAPLYSLNRNVVRHVETTFPRKRMALCILVIPEKVPPLPIYIRIYRFCTLKPANCTPESFSRVCDKHVFGAHHPSTNWETF